MARKSNKTAYRILKVGRGIAAIKNMETSKIFVPIEGHPAGILGVMTDGCAIHTIGNKRYLSLAEMTEVWQTEKTNPGKESQMKVKMLEALAMLPSKFEEAQPA
ncbi:MAG: hypothetical protein ACK4WH_05180 [Phycisphaerales bacterium]